VNAKNKTQKNTTPAGGSHCETTDTGGGVLLGDRISAMTTPLYRIRDWNKHFENSRSRAMEKMSWVPVPNRHDGYGYLTVLAHEQGLEIYACWHLLLQVASKCNPRGTLVRDNGVPHSAATITRMTGSRHEDVMQLSLDFLSSSEVGWVEVVDTCPSPARHDHDTHLSLKERIEGKEQKETGVSSATPTSQISSALVAEYLTVAGRVSSPQTIRDQMDLAVTSDPPRCTVKQLLDGLALVKRGMKIWDYIDLIAPKPKKETVDPNRTKYVSVD